MRFRAMFCRPALGQAALAAAVGALAGLAVAPPLLAQQGARVSIANFSFQPAAVSVARRAPIAWVNNDSTPRSVVVASRSLKTATPQKGQTARLSIADPGRYTYACGIHPSMTGTIEVK